MFRRQVPRNLRRFIDIVIEPRKCIPPQTDRGVGCGTQSQPWAVPSAEHNAAGSAGAALAGRRGSEEMVLAVGISE